MRVAMSGVTVRYGEVLALDALTVEIAQGSTMAVCGPAGSGKTTFLKVLAGLVTPVSGEVRWGSQTLSALNAQQKRALQAGIGMVFQSDALFDSMTVLENVLLPLKKRKVDPDEAIERAREALTQVGLEHAAAKRPEELSGGMKKRLGVARAIVSRPAVLLADDPFAGLDPATEKSIAKLLLDVSVGRTLIAALPDPLESLPVARLLHLNQGRAE